MPQPVIKTAKAFLKPDSINMKQLLSSIFQSILSLTNSQLTTLSFSYILLSWFSFSSIDVSKWTVELTGLSIYLDMYVAYNIPPKVRKTYRLDKRFLLTRYQVQYATIFSGDRYLTARSFEGHCQPTSYIDRGYHQSRSNSHQGNKDVDLRHSCLDLVTAQL